MVFKAETHTTIRRNVFIHNRKKSYQVAISYIFTHFENLLQNQKKKQYENMILYEI